MTKRFPINNKVRELREQHGQLSQSELGKIVGVTRQTIAAIEQRRYSPSLEVSFKIANYFNCDIGEVFQWEE
ncbi:helix-turn-helix transcriptional regulator [Kangiella sp. HZ709]|uniref:helix-turn-helix transcriptional regulator n=1 Tax=Kangiella sp. HZ709 TaxID=2666328 RepID=UPI0012AEF1B4|nr:helix-turn-helix transcriptional regulator [Kangiella sp. HZ709]MRX28016.1 helix-turn-helix domain-containing protein [Kangiella sp. HZ709]